MTKRHKRAVRIAKRWVLLLIVGGIVFFVTVYLTGEPIGMSAIAARIMELFGEAVVDVAAD